MVIGADTTSWYIGLGLGAIVVVVAVIIVSTILVLANRIAGQAETASEAIETLRSQTDGLSGVAKVNDSGVRILHSARALRKTAVGH
jgi:predicted house-cleaning NTP pyrophosphatase (Maf/HAM1 superfamily)